MPTASVVQPVACDPSRGLNADVIETPARRRQGLAGCPRGLTYSRSTARDAPYDGRVMVGTQGDVVAGHPARSQIVRGAWGLR